MKSSDLNYSLLSKRVARVTERTGLGESASFLVWFLENVYRLEETDARDAVCDHSNDKGIDGIYVDHNNEEVRIPPVPPVEMCPDLRRSESAVGPSGPNVAVRQLLRLPSRQADPHTVRAREGGCYPAVRTEQPRPVPPLERADEQRSLPRAEACTSPIPRWLTP